MKINECKQHFITCFHKGDINGAKNLLQQFPELSNSDGYQANPLLRECITHNNGHCYKRSHMLIADLFIHEIVRSFRDAIVNDHTDDILNQLQNDSTLSRAELTAGRGISQALHHCQSVKVAEKLLETGADINAFTTRSDTPLCLKLRDGDVEGSRFLLKNGADPNIGRTKLMPKKSMNMLVNLLLDYGWNINEKFEGQTLMHHDANHGHGSKIKILLHHGANPNCQNKNGQTPLHLIAARGVGKETIRALVQSGADTNAKDNEGYTPLDLAKLAKRQVASRELTAL